MIVDVAVYRDGRRIDVDGPLAVALRACRRAEDGFVWIGLHEPTSQELAEVSDEFDLHDLAVEDALHAHQRPKIEVYGESLFMVLRTAVYRDSAEIVDLGEVMVFAGDRFVVTVRHGDHNALQGLRKELEAEPRRLARGPMAVLHAIADKVVDEYELVLDLVNVDVDQIEAEVFSTTRDDRSERVFKLKRELLDFRRAVGPLPEALTPLAESRVPNSVEELGPWFRDVLDHVYRVNEHLDGLDGILSSALQANLAQVTVRQNEDMRKISAAVAIAAVPTAIAGIYGMNFQHMPELGWQYGYPITLAGIAVICLGLYRGFRKRGWL